MDIADDLAEFYMDRFAPVADQVRARGLLGPARSGAASPADRLLDFCGRRR